MNDQQPSLSSLYLCFVVKHTQCGTLLLSHLPKDSIVQLSLASKQLSIIVRDFINQNNNEFDLEDNSENTRTPTLNQPKKIVVNIDYLHLYNSDPSITQINLGKKFSSPITLPQPNLSHLSFDHTFTHSLTLSSSNITHLTLHKISHRKIQLPLSITHFTFLGNFLHPSFNKKIPNITHLTLLCSCDFSIENFPHNITHLKFLRSLQSNLVDLQPIERILPSFQCLTIRGYDLYVPYPANTKGFGFPVLSPNESNEPNQARKTGFEPDSNNIISQLIIAANLFFNLDTKSVLQLALVSKAIFKHLSPFIEENIPFNFFDTTYRIPIMYKPKKAKIVCSESEEGRLRHPPRLLTRLVKNLPLTTTHVQFCDHVDKKINSKLYPQSVVNLTYGMQFNQFIHNNDLPPNLKHLTLGYFYNKCIDELPSTLTHLTLDNNFTAPVDRLPPNLIYLKFDWTSQFSQLIDHLPVTLTTLITGIKFDSPIDHLPPNLTTLFLGKKFNHPIDKLPPNLKSLEFGQNDFSIEWGSRFNTPIDKLPHSLTTLLLGLQFNQHIDHLPPNVTHLNTGFYFNHNIDRLPDSITYLKMSHKFNQPIKKLPNSLKSFKLGVHFNNRIDNLHIATNLTHLKFSKQFNQKIQHFPPNLEFLKLGFRYNKKIQSLPSSLTHLSVSVKYVHSFHFLPLSLQHLTVKPTPPKNEVQIYLREVKKEATTNFGLYLKNLVSLEYCDVKIV